MKVVGINQYGSSKMLREMELAKPSVTDNQVLIKSAAVSINPVDWKMREGYLKRDYDWLFPIILGFDVAGVITEIGADVTSWQVGERVVARRRATRLGAYAEYVAVDSDLLVEIPESITYEYAAATPLASLTAWQALFDHGKLLPHETVLIHAGAGGVGTFAIQFAKHIGARVITTASKKNHPLLIALGADEVIDYHETDFSKVVTDVDLVIDGIGGAVQQDSISVLRSEVGRIVSIVGLAHQTTLPIGLRQFTAMSLITNGPQLKEIFSLMEQGSVKPVIAEVFPFSGEGLRAAHQLSETGHVVGKIVVTF